MPSNPIRNKLTDHGAVGYGKIDKYEADLYKIYIRARNRIESELSTFLQRKGASFTGPRLVSLMDELNDMFPEFEEEYRNTYQEALSYMAKQNYATALHDMGLKENVVGSMDKSLFENMRDDAFTHIAGATQNMQKEVVSNLRRMSAQVMREATLTGATRAEVSRRLAAETLYGRDSIYQQGPTGPKPGSFAFVDVRGRKWKNNDYFEMLGRTLLHNNARECYLSGCAKSGSDIVTVSISGDPCDKCLKWENVLLSISGKTPGLRTVQQAIDAGLCHPRCRHRFVAVPEAIAQEYYDKHGKPVEGINSEGGEPVAQAKPYEIKNPEPTKRKVEFTPAKTFDEAVKFSKTNIADNLLFTGNFKNLEVLNRINELIYNNMQDFGFNRFAMLKTFSGDNVAGIIGTKIFCFNPKHLQNGKNLFKSQVADFIKNGRQRYFALSDEENIYKHVIDHEFGHLIFNRARNLELEKKLSNVFSTSIKNGDMKNISQYASIKETEFFAEVFAMNKRGDKLPAYISDFINEVLK